jgi:hypothetical protein
MILVILVLLGYQQGFEEGRNEGSSEGFHFGYHRGADVGAKLGYYLGFIDYHQQKSQHNEKIQKSLEDLKIAIESFPETNADDVDIVTIVENLSAQFKKLCMQLKVKPIVVEKKSLSF